MTDFNNYQPDHLYFLPLGGAGEFGRNLNLYHWNGHWLMVDLGISFHDGIHPSGSLILPDISYIEKHRKMLAGIIVTHAHEDHIGGIAYLWPRLRCPVYATPFAAAFLRARLRDNNLPGDIDLITINPGENFYAGPFHCRALPVTHSIPESTMIEIRTPLGRIVHTGDWKIDMKPAVGRSFEPGLYQEMGDAGTLLVVSDSTNANVPGRSGDEREVEDGLTTLFSRLPNRILVTCFASNVGRIKSVALAAAASGREVYLIGRSLWRFSSIARDLGYYSDLPPFMGPRELKRADRRRTVLICTGSQGETPAALSRIATGQHPKVQAIPGDHVVFSARIIPGNEQEISALKDLLRLAGQHVISPGDVPERIYSSGHPCRGEIAELYRLLKPAKALPVHGTALQQEANRDIALGAGIAEVHVPTNGEVVQVAPGPLQVVGKVATGTLVHLQENR